MGLSPKKRKRLISGISNMVWKALSWMLVDSYATKITLKHYYIGLFEECLKNQSNKEIFGQIKSMIFPTGIMFLKFNFSNYSLIQIIFSLFLYAWIC